MNSKIWIILFLLCPTLMIIVLWGKMLKKLLKLLVWGYVIFYFLVILNLIIRM